MKESSAESDRNATTDLAAALELLWVRFLPEIRQRVELLETAAAAFAGNHLSAAQREAAHAASHKLAGTLGTFNLSRGTELAREFELLFCREDRLDSNLGGRLASIAAELRTIVENRK